MFINVFSFNIPSKKALSLIRLLRKQKYSIFLKISRFGSHRKSRWKTVALFPQLTQLPISSSFKWDFCAGERILFCRSLIMKSLRFMSMPLMAIVLSNISGAKVTLISVLLWQYVKNLKVFVFFCGNCPEIIEFF